jgi:quercetin dioxygenase-like cupin family protein
MRWVFCLVFLPMLSCQSTTVHENPTVRVLDALDRPHQKTALHKHDFNRVMIYITAGDLDVTSEDGKTEHQHWKAGDVAWSPAGPLHVSENVGRGICGSLRSRSGRRRAGW